ncbi:MAG TPA: hypothetical protein VGK50_05375 [Coriobacteriia bacterium]|jgi:uncharacterized protein YaaR (DUF327 family)
MIEHVNMYRDYIEAHGVGDNDEVASSADSYVSYLNSVATITQRPISPRTLRTEDDVEATVRQLHGTRAPKTIANYRSALRQYVAMVAANNLE